jgi:hypothetical protein
MNTMRTPAPGIEPVPTMWLLRLINVAFVTFIYCNVLFPKWTIGAASLSKLALAVSLLLFGAYAVLNPSRRASKALPFIATAFALISALAVIGTIKGNRFQDVMIFVSPFLMLLSIPMIQTLTASYGRTTYLRHITISASLLAFYMLYLYLARGPMRLPEEALLLPEQPGFTSVSFPGGTPKVIAVTAGFFPAGLVAAYFLSVTGGVHRYYLSIVLIAAGVYIGQTMGIWIASVTALFGGALAIRTPSLVRTAILWTTIPIIAAATVGNAVARGDALNPWQVFETKLDSIDQKALQTIELFDVFIESPIFGRGLGHMYQLNEITSLSDNESLFVEASYSMLLASTGIVGLLFYGYIYLYYPMLYLLRLPRDGPTTVIAISHVAVLVASAGLPYLWSGGIGFFFLSFLIAWIYTPVPVAEAPVRPATVRRVWGTPVPRRAAFEPRVAQRHTGIASRS